MSKKDATGKTMPIVYGVWAMVIGTAVIWWIKAELYPDLVADGSLDGDWPILLGAFALGVVVAAPSVFMSRAANFIEAVKDWRGRG